MSDPFPFNLGKFPSSGEKKRTRRARRGRPRRGPRRGTRRAPGSSGKHISLHKKFIKDFKKKNPMTGQRGSVAVSLLKLAEEGKLESKLGYLGKSFKKQRTRSPRNDNSSDQRTGSFDSHRAGRKSRRGRRRRTRGRRRRRTGRRGHKGK